MLKLIAPRRSAAKRPRLFAPPTMPDSALVDIAGKTFVRLWKRSTKAPRGNGPRAA